MRLYLYHINRSVAAAATAPSSGRSYNEQSEAGIQVVFYKATKSVIDLINTY